MTQVRVPASTEELDQLRALMRAFVAWHREPHRQDLALIDAYFDAAAFEEELASLAWQVCASDGSAPPHHGPGEGPPAVLRCGRSTRRAVR